VSPGADHGLQVRGGAFSIAARLDDLRAFAGALDQAGRAAQSAIGAAVSVLGDPDVLKLALLDPGGALSVAEHAGRVVVAAGVVGAECALAAQALRSAAAAYQATDDLGGRLRPLAAAVGNLPRALTAAGADLTLGPAGLDLRRTVRGLDRLLQADPDLLAPVLDGLGGNPLFPMPIGLVSTTTATSPIPGSAAMLATVYPDGRPELSRQREAVGDDASGPPRTVADVVRGLACRNDHTDGGGLDVRFVTHLGPDGQPHRAVIVDLPGTKDWSLTDTSNPNVADIGTNLHAMAGQITTYERGVLLALVAAGVAPDEPIMLVGHSQGGLVAARLAVDLAGSDRFRVTHVVTAGAPIGLVDLPGNVQSLALENAGDVVPELDAADNPARRNHVTVRTDRGGEGVGQRHDLRGAYLPAATDIDSSDDRSVRAWVDSAAPFLTGRDVSTEVFQVSRRR
jgi:pimeloyl-ACP methyl ester carboxylesterase